MQAVLPAASQHVAAAVAALRREEIIAVPTDTIYGFAADACSANAIRKIYAIKGRNPTNPLAICVADIADVARFASTQHLPAGLLEDLLPGPVTLVLPRGAASELSPSLNPGAPGVGVRIPHYDFLRAVARSLGGALALTSANRSTEASATAVDEFEPLWAACALVFDGGPLPGGRSGSTVVALPCPGEFNVLRPGSAELNTVGVLQDKYNLRQKQA